MTAGIAAARFAQQITAGKAEVAFRTIFGTKWRTKRGKVVFRYVITPVTFYDVRKYNQVVK